MLHHLRDFLFVLVTFLILIFGAIIENSTLGYLITLAFSIYALIDHKRSILILFIYFPMRPFLTELNPSLKAIGDVLIFVILCKVIYLKRKQWKSLLHFNLFELAFFSFCLVGSLSAFLNGVGLNAIIFQLRAFLLLYLLYYIIRRINVTRQDIMRFICVTTFMVLVLCVHGLIEKLSLRSMLLPTSWEEMQLPVTNRVRIYGLIGNPNELALYLSLSFLILLSIKRQLSHLIGNWIYIVLILLTGVWFLTFSRGTWIGFVIGLVVYLLASKDWKVLKHIVVTFALGLLLVATPTVGITNVLENKYSEEHGNKNGTSGITIDRLKGTFDEKTIESSTNAGRIFRVKKGIEIFKDYPIIGSGFGTFGDSAILVYGSPIYEEYGISERYFSDNQYIQVITQTGVIGTILFAMFLLGMLILIWKKDEEPRFRATMLSIIISAFVVGLVYNLWESDIFTVTYFGLLAVYLNDHKIPE